MNISIFGLENKILLENDKINILEIYNKKFFCNIITELINAESENNNQIVLTENGKRLDISKEIYVLTDVFNIEFNSKKIINKIYNIIIENIKNRQDNEIENISLKLRNYLIEEINELPFEFSMNSELEANELLRIFNLKIDVNCYNTIVEKVEYIINLISTLKIAKILVIPNLKIYLDEKELIEIYKYSLYNNVKLLILENNRYEGLLTYERKNIIDEEFNEF